MIGEVVHSTFEFGPNGSVGVAGSGETLDAACEFFRIEGSEVVELHRDGTRSAVEHLRQFDNRWMGRVLFPERRAVVEVEGSEKLVAGPVHWEAMFLT